MGGNIDGPTTTMPIQVANTSCRTKVTKWMPPPGIQWVEACLTILNDAGH